ncbi:MAG: GTP 3',8-cyclase MoaA [Robiginitomaculum sp.]|nr:MAG: GTP 3',8-cyclase MoaA [Robiginitomaculum sp.]
MQDAFGRSFAYLRLSVTDVCNFSCQYCLPDGFQKKPGPTFLSLDEIRRLATAFAALGLWKIRITGGEPTLRRDFTEIVRNLRAVKGVKTLATTTNGYKLRDNAQKWRAAGLDAINVSVDSFDPEIFHRVTGHNRLGEVLEGIEACLDAGYEAVKINAVLLKGINDQALDSYLQFVSNRPVSIRFIELMRTGDNAEYFNKYHVSADTIAEQLQDKGWVRKTREPGAGPALEYVHPDHLGRIGLIAPYSKDFCASCNRLRMSARGDLHLCLFSEKGISVRHLLQSDDQQAQLQEFIQGSLTTKRVSHFLHDGNSGGMAKLADIGG